MSTLERTKLLQEITKSAIGVRRAYATSMILFSKKVLMDAIRTARDAGCTETEISIAKGKEN